MPKRDKTTKKVRIDKLDRKLDRLLRVAKLNRAAELIALGRHKDLSKAELAEIDSEFDEIIEGLVNEDLTENKRSLLEDEGYIWRQDENLSNDDYLRNTTLTGI